MFPILDQTWLPYFLGALTAMLAFTTIATVINIIFKRRNKNGR